MMTSFKQRRRSYVDEYQRRDQRDLLADLGRSEPIPPVRGDSHKRRGIGGGVLRGDPADRACQHHCALVFYDPTRDHGLDDAVLHQNVIAG